MGKVKHSSCRFVFSCVCLSAVLLAFLCNFHNFVRSSPERAQERFVIRLAYLRDSMYF